MDYQLKVQFDKGYIAHPYWPERERLINIQKESGTKRARSEGKAKQALDAYLSARGMTQEEYADLVAKADRQFYRNDDEAIIIPAHHVYGCFAQTCDIAPAAVRLSSVEQLRTVLQTTDWHTGKKKPDGVWERFAVVTAGTGAKLSNQRALRSNEYIEHFTSESVIHVVAEIEMAKLRRFVEFAGREVGIGASRKLGWGRFSLISLEYTGIPGGREE